MERKLVLKENNTDENIINSYFTKLENLYTYFGINLDCVSYPIEDRREFYWGINNGEEVIMASYIFNTDNGTDNIYHEEIAYDDAIYRGEHFTMILVNTVVDRGDEPCFAIYDNSRELKIE